MSGGSTTRVRKLTAPLRLRWDEFVTRHPGGTFFHKSGWQPVIERAFGYETRYLYAERCGVITGVLPLVHVRSWVFGNALISTAFCVYGGPLAANCDAERVLRDAALREMTELRADRIEFRFRQAAETDWLQLSGRHATFRRSIDPDPEENLLTIRRKQRAVIRKSLDSGLIAECDTNIDRLHRVYAESVRNLGSPVFPRRYFSLLFDEFGTDCEILTVVDRGEPIASVLSFFFRDEVLPYYGGGTPAARSGANDFMYWEVMRRAATQGYRIFDFGRSKVDSGPYNFKKNWGFTPQPLIHEFKLRSGCDIPDTSPMNPKLQNYIGVWKRLPLPVTNLIGPRLIRTFGFGA